MEGKFTDREYLKGVQYKGAGNLMARIKVHEGFSLNRYGMQKWVLDRLDLPESAAVLELGCGPGDLWFKNRERIPAGWTVTLTDLSAGMVEEAMSRLAGWEGGRYSVVDAQAAPFPDLAFDGVVANHMLYHVPDREKALAEIWRVLRPGGRLYATTNGPSHLRELDELLIRFGLTKEPESLHTGMGGGSNFSLENGPRQLERWFDAVEVLRYEDALVITEAEPLLEYARSMITTGVDVEALEEMKTYLEMEILEKGAIRITKDAGMVKARRREKECVMRNASWRRQDTSGGKRKTLGRG